MLSKLRAGVARSLTRAARWLRAETAAAPSYAGAQINRLFLDWIWSHLSADKEIHGDLITLRTRARELIRNTSWGKNYVRLLRNNVIGHRGIGLQGRLRKADDTPAKDLNTQLEAAWKDWSARETCTVDGKLSWRGVQRLAITSLAMDGEFLARHVEGFDNAYAYALQVLDPDYLDHTYSRARSADQNEIRYGVEIDIWNRPVAYHLWENHPSELSRGERRRIPASEIIHLYDPYRVAQTRGVTWLAPVMLGLHMLQGYFEAELVASRQGAAKGGFFVKKGENLDPGEGVDETGKAIQPLRMEVEPGTYDKLPAGWEFQPNDPQHPTTAFPEFVKATLRAIATGLGVSYTALTNDLSDVNYSSIRAGILNEHDEYRDLQQLVIEGLCAPVYRKWLRMTWLTGILDTRVALARYAAEVEWEPRGWTWVDPEKEANAAILAIENGLTSRKRVLAAQGLDLEEVFADLADEQKLAESYGLDFSGPASIAAGATDGQGAQRGVGGNQSARGLSGALRVANRIALALAKKPHPAMQIAVGSPELNVEHHHHNNVTQPAAPNVSVTNQIPEAADKELVVSDPDGKVIRRMTTVHKNGRKPRKTEVVGG
jgi:lambda family phage portal protein